MKKKVSAIITTHNRLDLLKNAINSVFNQTYKNIELIVVDDGSTDGTLEFCKSDKRIIYIYISPKNHKNGNYARNLGIKNSKGYYVAFLDDDDEWMKDKIEKQVNFLEQNKELSLVTCLRKKLVNNQYIYNDKIHFNQIDQFQTKVFYNLVGTTSTYLAKKEDVINIGMFDENLNVWQDVEFITNMAIHYKIGILNEHLVLYRRNFYDKNRVSNGNIDRWIESVKYINDKYKYEIDNLSDDEKIKRELFILNDKALRYQKFGNNKMKRKCLKQIYLKNRTFNKFIKYLLNISSDDILLLNIKIKRHSL